VALLAAAAARGLASGQSRLASMDRARSAVARAKMLRESPLYAEHFDERTVAACRELFSGEVSTTITSKKAAATRRGLTTQAWDRSKLRMATAMVELKRGEAAASFALTRALAEAHPAQVVPLLDISYRS
jgi:DNA-directed RNA polymerase subunit K/omega